MRFVFKILRISWRPIYRFSRPLVRKLDRKKIANVSESELIKQQQQLFGAIGLDWKKANSQVIQIEGQSFDPKSHRSQHYELIVALADNSKPKRILEIGTAEASFTAFLSRAFPDATIETIDLPTHDKRFWNAVDDEEKRVVNNSQVDMNKVRMRDDNLKKSPNVIFKEMNSLALSRFQAAEYDFIWVDGDHTFPVVACDIANAVRLLKEDGTLICDDIFLTGGRKGKWGSQESQKVLKVFADAEILSTNYVLKSLLAQRNFNSSVKKHLAVCKLL